MNDRKEQEILYKWQWPTHWKTNTVNMSCDSIKSLLDVECAVTFTYFVYIKKSVCLISADKTICLTRLRSWHIRKARQIVFAPRSTVLLRFDCLL